MARAPVSKTGGCRFESCHSCQPPSNRLSITVGHFVIRWATLSEAGLIAAATAAVFYEVGNLAQPKGRMR
jgi:hypothetical protein